VGEAGLEPDRQNLKQLTARGVLVLPAKAAKFGF
jgi:hypothetical protein